MQKHEFNHPPHGHNNERDNMRTDRKEDLDTYYNDHLKMKIIRRLQMVSTWSELMGIDSAVWDALNNEDKAEQDEQKEFKAWKKTKAE